LIFFTSATLTSYFLENTYLTVNEIADKIGLHKSNFARQFKKLTGKTPLEWRKNPGERKPAVNHQKVKKKQRN